jgi:hypothetical protein
MHEHPNYSDDGRVSLRALFRDSRDVFQNLQESQPPSPFVEFSFAAAHKSGNGFESSFITGTFFRLSCNGLSY